MELSNVKALAVEWRKLRTLLTTNNKLEYELFKKVFEETRDLLAACATADSIDKSYMSMIVEAYKFSGADGTYKDARPQAALVMTERMLQHYVLDSHVGEVRSGVYVYVLEEKEELYIDFKEVDTSIAVLTRALDKRY